ncbi:crAss001_48 related protein [Enterobacter hormaechei]|uniref:crAss001_48 related protein n=1 Tax=Enterobacter cloacae complex TaxID=354276 RepID=UPI003CC53499
MPHQKRVMDEHEELCGRIKKLKAYIAGAEFARLLYVDRIILIKQLDAMKAYDLILRARIARF